MHNLMLVAVIEDSGRFSPAVVVAYVYQVVAIASIYRDAGICCNVVMHNSPVLALIE